MANWIDDGDSWAMLGPSNQLGTSTLSFGASDYATGGYAVQPADFGMGHIRGLIPCAYQGGAEGYSFIYDDSSKTVKAYNGTSQVSASSNFAPGQVKFQANGY